LLASTAANAKAVNRASMAARIFLIMCIPRVE
jgi:hypothetical protein